MRGGPQVTALAGGRRVGAPVQDGIAGLAGAIHDLVILLAAWIAASGAGQRNVGKGSSSQAEMDRIG